jgi:endonuclease III
MKNATKHADSLRAAVKKLVREHKPEPRGAIEPLEALVRGILSFDASDEKVEEAMRAIHREFTDLNELRVATELEVQDLLGARYPKIEQRTSLLWQILNAIFDKEHTLSLERIRSLGKKDMRGFFRELPGMTPYVEAYVTLIGMEGSALPVDESMLAWLKEHQAVTEEASLDEAQRFCESHLKADEMYDAFRGLRAAVFDGKKKK